jgi:hypothetical protein
MRTLFFITVSLSVFSCKKNYDCECVTETLSHFPTITTSNKQISAVSKSSAAKKCSKYNHQGNYGGEMTTCQIK